MKYIITFLIVATITAICVGFYIKSFDPKTGEIVIGLSIMFGSFIVMPLFIYHRWKNKKVQDYMLTRENIEKMREFNDGKKKL